MSVNQPLTDSEAKNIFINGAEDFYSLSANPQFSNVAELFDAWLTEHDRQLLAKTETEAGNESPANSNSNMQATPTPERNHPAHTFKDARPREACSRTPSET